MENHLPVPRYPIGAVSQLTGIPVDTLRAWERRYGVVVPERDRRGRLYGEADVRKLRLLRTLVERGHAIGRLASKSEAELRMLETPSAQPVAAGSEPDLSGLSAAIDRFDAAALRTELGRLAALFPPRQLVHEYLLPMMRRVGDGWVGGKLSVAQEHLASAALRDVMGTIVRTHAPEVPPAVLAFATPPNERHELGILAAAMIAVGGGLGAVFLGPDLPPDEIAGAARRTGARAVVLGVFATSGSGPPAAAIEALARDLPRGVDLWVGGPPVEEVVRAVQRAGGRHLPTFQTFEQALTGLGARF